jgi:hypothetical protein
MSAYKHREINASVHSDETEIFKTVLDDRPVAVAIWRTDHSILFINNHAVRLTGFANSDLSGDPTLWCKRVHVDDRAAFSSSWGELRKGTRKSICDYRFFPKHSETAVRLMEVSVFMPGLRNGPELVVSVYKGFCVSEEPKHEETARVLRTLLHDVQNCLHTVKMEIELSDLGLQRRPEPPTNSAKTLCPVEQLQWDLRDYFGANAAGLTIEDLESLLKNIVRRMREQRDRHKVNLRLVRRGPLPPVEMDKNQVSGALERVLESCSLLVEKGGDIKIESGQIDVRGQPYAELKVTTTSAESFGIDVSDSLRSSVRVGENQVGIAIGLAHEILRRYHGQVTFRQENARETQVIIRMKGLSI